MREGLLVELEDEHAAARCVERLRTLGYRDIDAFTPFPSEEVTEAMALPRSRLPLFVLSGAITGGSLGYAILYATNVVDYPLNVGGRDPHPWQAFMPITFESAVLFAGLAAFFGFFALCRLPKLYTPIFDPRALRRATTDGFFVAVSATDALFDEATTRRELEALAPVSVARFPREEVA